MRGRLLKYRAALAALIARTGAVRPESGAAPRFSSALIFLFVFILAFTSLLHSNAGAATPAGTVINNVATVTFMYGSLGGPLTANSNMTSVTTIASRTTATIELMQYAPSAPGAQNVVVGPTAYSTSGASAGPFVPEAPPMAAGGAPINLANPLPLVPVTLYHAGEPVFIRLTDHDQNLNPAVADTVIVTIRDNATGDSEVLRITETGPNTGVFTGYIQTGPGPSASGNGTLNVTTASMVTASYTDVADNTDAHSAWALVDPLGLVFDSMTGQPVNGATVTIIDSATNLPATVFGDDGVSSFPSSVISGGSAADSSGKAYVFTPGGFRFPFIRPGQYRLTVTPPNGYRAPSGVPTSFIQTLPGGPFAIVPGSRGDAFIVNAGPAVRIDVPIDPVSGGLWLMKTAGKATAATGDFVPYTLILENTVSSAIAPAVSVVDRLAPGFRYQKGSARINGVLLADPAVSPDGRGLTFAVGDLAPSATATITYVTGVTAGARPGTAINMASAVSSLGASSNIATATVQIVEDLFHSTATIAGRVVIDGCGDPALPGDGLAGVRIYLEDGTSVVSDKNGQFHFPAVKPGSHVVQLDTVTVPEEYEVGLCEDNTAFSNRAFSQFVDLQGGTLWRADFHLVPKPDTTGEIGIELRSALKTGGTGTRAEAGKEVISYAVPLHAGSVPARDLRVTVMLPEGATYLPATSALNASPVDDPQITGGAVTFRIPEATAGWEGTIRFEALVPVGGPAGELTTRAVLMADTPRARNVRTPVVETTINRVMIEQHQSVPDIVLRPRFASLSAALTEADRKQLDSIAKNMDRIVVERITVTGHTDSLPILHGGRKKFADNYVLSRARAETIAAYLAKALGLPDDRVTIIGKGPDEPVATNKTTKGRTLNRRVELQVETKQIIYTAELHGNNDSSGMKVVATRGLPAGRAWKSAAPGVDPPAMDPKTMPEYDAAWLETAQPGTAWLWPAEGRLPVIANTKIAIKHDPGSRVRLLQNGAEVEGIYFEGTARKADNTLAVSVWKGIHLFDGDNRFEAVLLDASGAETGRVERIIHYSGRPVRAELVPERSRLIADGRTPSVIAVRLFDKDSRPALEGIREDYVVDPPYLPQKRVQELQQSPLTAAATDRLKYEVGENGIALIELAPTTQTGQAVLRLTFENSTQELRVWLKPEVRDWILVGLAEGTAGYNRVTGNMETMANSGAEDRYYNDGRVAFYAKGQIKGEWLLTAAYESSAANATGNRSMYQTIDPNKYYTLYGDSTDTHYDAASAKRIYIKLERDQFYALFGDYDTGLTVTELSRYSRNFTGFKSELKSDKADATVFASETNQAFVRDEIPGDGTSGLYRLSRRNIVINSETIVIETRDRFHSEVILSTQQLSRYLDYTIDYDSGTLFFKSPVFNRDSNFNPIYIVAAYESFDASDLSYNYGGRGAVRLMDNRVEVGGTYIHEGQVGGASDLIGTDATVKLSETTKARAEIAETRNNDPLAGGTASAYLTEVTHQSARFDGKVYVREEEQGFGLGQQNVSESGTRKMGVDLAYRFTEAASLRSSAFRQETLSTGAVRDVGELQGRYAASGSEYFAGLRHAEDSFSTGMVEESDQIFGGIRYRANDRLTLRLQHDETVGGRGENADYPTRTTMGADYRLNTSSTLFVDEELTRGDDRSTATTRVGLRSSPWTGAQIGSTMEQQATESGTRLFSTTGLKQSWQISKEWSVDAGLDRSSTIHHSETFLPNPNVPPASGGEDFTAVTLGAGYRQEHWSWTGRIEHRVSDLERRIGMFTGANGELMPGWGLAGAFQGFRTDGITGSSKKNEDLRLGFAYRPPQARWIILDRLDLIVEEQEDFVSAAYNNRRVVNNLSANYKVPNMGQVSLQYGAKYVGETIDSQDFHGYTDLIGLEGRYDITKRLDVGLRGSTLRSWSADQKQYGSALSVGVTLSTNLWMSIGYNMTGYRDRDFSKSEFTAAGPFIKLRLKFDQATVREAAKWATGQ
ncbi:MAG TPA: OmpA family protein [Nitrospirota bacterium]|nr:OmpA family protein [Nitrospirota bacterium]